MVMAELALGPEYVDEAVRQGVVPDLTLLERMREEKKRLTCSPARALLALRDASCAEAEVAASIQLLLRWPFTTQGLFEPGGPRDGEGEQAYTCLSLVAWQIDINPVWAAELFVANEDAGLSLWDPARNRYKMGITLPAHFRGVPPQELVPLLRAEFHRRKNT